MEEYHDGILLFNIMDNKVWSKAVKDTAGLRSYYEQHANDYRWKERADVSVYTLKDAGIAQINHKTGKEKSKEKMVSR